MDEHTSRCLSSGTKNRFKKRYFLGVRATLDAEIAKELDQAYNDETAGYLKKIAQKLRKRGIVVKVEVLEGNPADEIIQYSKDNELDLIIMSTHGRSGFSRLVFGSVADKVLRQTEVSLLLRPAGHVALN